MRVLNSQQPVSYGLVGSVTALALGGYWLTVPFVGPQVSILELWLLLFVAVVISAYVGGWKSGLLATFLAALGGSGLLFAFPNLQEPSSLSGYWVLAVFVLQSGLVSGLMGALHQARQQADGVASQAEAQLEDQSLWLHRLTDYLHEIFWVFSPQQNRLLYVSAAYEQIWGRPVDELYANPLAFLEAVHPDDRDRVRSARTNHAHKEYYEEYRVFRPDGSMRWVRSQVFPILNAAGNPQYLAGITEDITHCRQTETALQETRAYARQLIDSNIIGVILTDFQGNIIDANQAFLNTVGYTQADFQAGLVNWIELTPPEHRYQDQQVMQALLETGVHKPFEKEYIHKDGSRVPVLIGAALLERDQRTCVAFVLDRSDRQQVLSALQRNHNLFQAVIETVPDLIFIKDLQGRFVMFNSALANFLGKSTEELMGRSGESMWPSQGIHQLQETDLQVMATGETVTFEEAVQTAAGRSLTFLTTKSPWRDDHNRIIGLIGIARDISDRKQSEEKIRRLNEALEQRVTERTSQLEVTDHHLQVANSRLRGIIEGTQDLIAALDLEFCFMVFNQPYQRAFAQQFQRQIEPGMSLLEALADLPEHQAEAQALWQRALQGEAFTVIQTFSQADGQRQYYEITYNPIWAGKQQIGASHVVRDITRQKQTEAEIHHLNEVLEQRVAERTMQLELVNQQLESEIAERNLAEAERSQLLLNAQQAREQAEVANRTKDEFLAIVSHELRSPLNAILGWARLLRTRSFDAERLQKALETIERSAQAQHQLIEDLLDMSRIIRGKVRLYTRPLQLVDVIESAVDAVRPTAETKSIQLKLVLEKSIGLVSGDPDRLQQVVWNLLSNAVKFTPDGGCVQVTLRQVEAFAEISVLDTGRGISPEFLPYVFERFCQAEHSTARNQGGLGLGLAIVRQLTELHGGTVQVNSSGLGQGATFTVQLPLLSADQAAPKLDGGTVTKVEAETKSSPSLDGLQVLVVEDEIDSRELLVTVLEQSGATVRAIATATEALAVLQTFQPDVLVSDIAMPGDDGYTLIRNIRALEAAKGGYLPAIALTAYARNEDRQQALAAGFQLHLSKPFNAVELVRAIATLGQPSRTKQHSPPKQD